MISSLHGMLESFGGSWAIVNVNGVGFQVFMPTSTLSGLGGIGKEVHLRTHLHLREDNVTLYGFGSPEELGLFQTLIGVSGFGPKLALASLSAMKVSQLSMAIATGNIDILTSIPGMGKKLASRLVLELKDKIGQAIAGTEAISLGEENAEVLAALTSLGYSVAEASSAIATFPTSSKLSLEEKIKLALQYFGGK